MPPEDIAHLETLIARLAALKGRDHDLDAAIAEQLDDMTDAAAVPPYTASVDRCLELLHRCLPDWHWHLGYGANGVLPYAVLTRGDRRHEAMAATVPLALLIALARASLELARDGG